MRTNVKPLVHWAIYKHYTLRFNRRGPGLVEGNLATPEGTVKFEYDPRAMSIRLPEELITINEHGWELSGTGEQEVPNAHPSDSPSKEDR